MSAEHFILSFTDEKIIFKENYEKTINSISDSAEVLEATQKLSSEQEQMLKAHQNELENFDISTILKLDHKVAEQQVTLEQAGVAGFYATKNSVEIKVQMILLGFICQLEEKEKSGELGYNSATHNKEQISSSDIPHGYSSGNSNNTNWW